MPSTITFRPYERTDLEAALALKAEQDRVLGQPMDFCDLTEHPVLIAEVAEIDGKIIGLHTLEAVPEYCVFSRDPRFTAAAAARAPQVAGLLMQHGFRSIRCLVPEWIEGAERIIEALGNVRVPVGDELRGFRPHIGCRQMVLDLRVKS